MLIVAALGGNALLRRGQPTAQENRRKNVRIAAQALSYLVPGRFDLHQGVQRPLRANWQYAKRRSSQMKLPLQITFSNMTPSESVRERIEVLAAKLERFNRRIMSCRVTVRAPNRGARSGRLYHVSIDLKLPGQQIVINRDPPQNQAHEDVYVAARDAFNALVRRLEDATRERRGDVKTRAEPSSGRITRLSIDGNYGFLQDPVAGEVYFHAGAVPRGGFRRLNVGSKVHYVAEAGDEELRATIVKPVGRARRAQT